MDPIPDIRARDSEGLSRIFRYYAEVETPRMNSPVYTEYCTEVAADSELLSLASQINRGQPAPNILFAAVQDLLLEDPEASPEARALAVFYPAISDRPIPEESAWPKFRSFCLAHADRLAPRLQEGRTQTCIVHRCTSLLPTLSVLPSVRAANGRIALLEIGPSAGLNLRLDRYRYDYGHGLVWGDANARPKLECEVRGDRLPPMPGRLEIVTRLGLDLNRIDLDDPAAIRWQRALVWPEHAWRVKIMDEALAHAKTVPVEIEEGDATREIARSIERLPKDAARILFASHVFYQISREGRIAILDGIAEASRDVPSDLILMDGSGEGDSRITWFSFEGGQRTARTTLARSDSHGRWIDWGRQ